MFVFSLFSFLTKFSLEYVFGNQNYNTIDWNTLQETHSQTAIYIFHNLHADFQSECFCECQVAPWSNSLRLWIEKVW